MMIFGIRNTSMLNGYKFPENLSMFLLLNKEGYVVSIAAITYFLKLVLITENGNKFPVP